jgi:hypothetical protein
MQTWPLLDIREALADADQNLADILYYVRMLQADTEEQYPTDGAQLLANVEAIRELLTLVIPPALQQAIVAEQAEYDREEARWEPTGY